MESKIPQDTLTIMSYSQIPVLVLNGSIGIGKSTTAESISYTLRARGVKHAIIDLDYVRRSYPAPSNDPMKSILAFKNLAALWSNYYADGARCLIVPSVVEEEAQLHGLRSAVPESVLTVIRLEASIATNHARIRRREIDKGALARNLKEASRLQTHLATTAFEDAVISTEDKSPNYIANEVLRYWGILIQPLSKISAT